MKALSASEAEQSPISALLMTPMALAGEEEELTTVVERLDKASISYGMEISAEKTKLMTNSNSGINKEIKVNGQKLETVTSFKYQERQERFSQFKDTTDALPCPIHLPVCL